MKDESTLEGTHAGSSTGPPSLLVIAPGSTTTFPLPEGQSVTIGRASDADVHIDDRSVSRHHARLFIEATPRIQDLGSFNGTRVMGVRIEPDDPVPFALGDVLEVGSVKIVLQRQPVPSLHPRIWRHERFDACVEEACSRHPLSRFAVVYVHVEGASLEKEVDEWLLEALRSEDRVGRYGPHEYEALLPGVDDDPARRIADDLLARAASKGWRARLGLASFPADGRSSAELLSRAWDQAAPASEHRTQAPAVEWSPAMRSVQELTERVAASDFTVLILGETGVGKEVLAAKIHRLSRRRDAPLVRLNCAALSESLLESEVFGYERGAFTGAATAKPGLVETAAGGTLLLDEIGELPLSVQAKLLRVIEDRHVLRVGGVTPREVDVRFLAATNRNLEAEIGRGTFRADLYYRLSAVTIAIPPLRERASEVAPLARTFIADAADQLGISAPPVLSPEALTLLERYGWPGNVRELRNMMQRAVLLSSGGRITTEHLPIDKLCGAPVGPSVEEPLAATTEAPPPPEGEQLRSRVSSFERERILEALRRTGGNQTKAAKLLGISRGTLWSRLKAYGLPRGKRGVGSDG